MKSSWEKNKKKLLKLNKLIQIPGLIYLHFDSVFPIFVLGGSDEYCNELTKKYCIYMCTKTTNNYKIIVKSY